MLTHLRHCELAFEVRRLSASPLCNHHGLSERRLLVGGTALRMKLRLFKTLDLLEELVIVRHLRVELLRQIGELLLVSSILSRHGGTIREHPRLQRRPEGAQ